MTLTWIHIVWTVVVCVVFVAIVFWAWSGKRKHAFDVAANIPLEEEDETASRGADRG